MKIFEHLQSWARAMEDIEDPGRSELRRLRDRVRVLEAEKGLLKGGKKRNTP